MFLGLFPILAFLITLVFTPLVGEFSRGRGILSPDLHKEGKPLIPELVGVTILLASSGVLLGAYLVLNAQVLLITGLAVTLAGLLGVADHYRPLTPGMKILGLVLIGLVYYAGPLPEGYLFLLIPLLFMTACNFTNMLAGFNGLEIGVGAVASLGVAAAAYLNGAPESFLIASTMGAALLGFLYYNRYPARVFPGDAGTLPIGAALFSAVLYGGLYLPGLVIFLPYVLDAGLKYVSAGVMSRHHQEPTLLRDGKLYPPAGGNLSLARLLLRVKPMGEKELVALLWLIEALFVSLGIALEVAL